MNLPPDIELRAVVDFIAKRLEWNIIYDDKLNGKTVTLAAPARVPAGSLPALLESVLKSKGFTLIAAAAPGWKRIVAAGDPTGDVQVASILAVNVDAASLAEQLHRLLGAAGRSAGDTQIADVSADPRSRQVIITGSGVQVAAATNIARLIDVPVAHEETPVRFYKLANTTAADVLDTIRSLEGEEPRPGTNPGELGVAGGIALPRPGITAELRSGAGAGHPFVSSSNSDSTFIGNGNLAGGSSGSSPGLVEGAGELGSSNAGASGGFAAPESGAGHILPNPAAVQAAAPAVRTKGATVAADTNTNSIIVIGPPSAQQLYENLIRQLDRRRPQVLVESTIVTVDTSHDLNLGVEISGNRAGDRTRGFVLSSFGLSQVNAATGALSPLPAAGLNAALLSSNVADALLQALATNTNSRIVASPRVLVNDNATGTLFAISEQPFTSVNANNEVSTTSFAGYAEAGTEITLTPHISENNYLQLEYEVALSNFLGQGSNGIPPPRQTNKVASEVTIPDGSTIVVGGLNRQENGNTVNAVPLLGDIPVLGALFRSTQRTNEHLTLFVFIRPIILRDDRFEDLQFLSGRDATRARVPDGAPSSEPLLIN